MGNPAVPSVSRDVPTSSGPEGHIDLGRMARGLLTAVRSEIHGARVLELFAGKGEFGLEALRQGARHVTFVDDSAEALRALDRRVRESGLEDQTTLLCGDGMVVPDPEKEDFPFGLVLLRLPSAGTIDHARAEQVIARVTALLRSRITGDHSSVLVGFPASYQDSLPFSHYEERRLGPFRLVTFRKWSLMAML